MILTAAEIQNRMRSDDIVVDPFDPHCLNPNSYNLALAPDAIFFGKQHPPLDMKEPARGKEIVLLEDGYLLKPGELLLGGTVEWTASHNLVPKIEGRSSLARMGLSVHITAGYGDIGYCGKWTLEMTCVLPIKIYPFVKICQIEWMVPVGEITQTYHGKYQHANGVRPSSFFEEFLTK